MYDCNSKGYKLLIAIVSGITFSLSGMTAGCVHNKIDLTLQNFKRHTYDEHGIKYQSVARELLIVDKHILIAGRSSYLDDAVDKWGDKYYFYMVDFVKGLAAYITKKELKPDEQPVEDSQEYEELQEFIDNVKRNIEKGGGIEQIIESFEKGQKIDPRLTL